MGSFGFCRVGCVRPRRFGSGAVPVWRSCELLLLLCALVAASNAVLIPTGTWSNIYTGASSASGTSSNTALPGGQPHFFGGTLSWRLNNLVMMCGGDAPSAKAQCATWNDQTETWVWINTTHLTSTQIRKYGSSWVDPSSNALYIYGGTDGTICGSNTMFRATVDPSTGILTPFQLVTSTSDPGIRSYATHWQDPATGYFYLFGGANCSSGTPDASNSDIWIFFPSNSSWTQLKDNIAGMSSTVTAALGVESAANWPSIRRTAQVVLSNSGRYVYMFGGVQYYGGIDYPLGDLWRYSFASGQWALLSGKVDSTYPAQFSHDVSGFDPSWLPAAARHGAMWMDGKGYIWMWGGAMCGTTMVNDLWSFSPYNLQWGRVKGMPFSHQTSILTAYGRSFTWPGTFTNPIAFRKSSDPSVLYTIGGWGFTSSQTSNGQALPDIWRLRVDVKSSLATSAIPEMPQAPAGHTPGLQAKWVQLTTCPPAFVDFNSAAAVATTNETGYLLRYSFGPSTKSSTPAGIDRTKCYGVQLAGYLWNPTSTPVTFRFWIASDDGVQIEWATPSNYVLQLNAVWSGIVYSPWSNHVTQPFFSDTLLLNPGATWFRVNYYDNGGNVANLFGGLVAEDSFSDFRMLHSSFVTQNYIPPTPTPTVMPTATWTPVDLRQASASGAAPDPNTWPGSVEESMKWEIGDFVVLCGSRTSGFARGCATWKHSTQSWVWVNATFMATGWKGAAAWTRTSESKLYMYGGASYSDTLSSGMWSAALDNMTGVLSPWQTVSQSGSPGARALAVFWQDSQENFYLFSGGNYEAAFDDMWMFNSSNAWTLISLGLPAASFFNASWSGTYGTEDPINWPGARSRSVVVRDRVNPNYVYIYGGGGSLSNMPSNDLWRFNMQTNRWALLSGSWYNRGPSWWQTGVFSSYTVPPAVTWPQMHADPNGQYLWLWSGLTANAESQTSMWCFRLSDLLWARLPSPNSKLLPTIKSGPPFWASQSHREQVWFYNGTIYTFGGVDVSSTSNVPKLPTTPKVSLWKLTVNVTTVNLLFPLQTSAPPTTPEPASNRGLTAKYYSGFSSCPSYTDGFLSFSNSYLKGTTNDTGALIRLMWADGTPPAIPAGTTCFAVEWTGYFWNTGTSPLHFKLKGVSDDGLQVEWRQPGAAVFTVSADYSASAWAPHGLIEYESDLMVAAPGPNWFRATFFDSGGSAGIYLNMVDPDGYTNPRMLHSDFFSKSVTPVLPQASWSMLYSQALAGSTSPDSPNPGVLPHYLQAANFWQFSGAIIACGGFRATYSDDCAIWSEIEEKWVWFGVATFTPSVVSGIPFVDTSRNRLWLYGGTNSSGVFGTLWYATYDPASFSITSNWQTQTVSSGPGPRAVAASWQDDSGNLWLWSGSNSTGASTADTADMWMLNINNLAWTLISAGPASSSAWRTSVFGTIGVEASTNWPQIRFSPSIARKRGSDLVYMYGGNVYAWEGVTELWRFSMTSRKWAFLGGTNRPWAGSSYTDGVYSPNYVPPSAFGGALFLDYECNLWLFGGTSAPGHEAFLWTYSVANQQLARVSGSPNTYHSKATSTWPGAMFKFGYFTSSLDANTFVVLGGYGFSNTGESALANVWKFRAGVWYTASPPQEPASLSAVDPYLPGLNVSYYQFTASGSITPAYSSFSGSYLVGNDIDTNMYLMRQDFGSKYVPTSSVSKTGTWGVRYEGYYYNPTQTTISLRFIVRSDDGAYVEWGTSTVQVLQGTAYATHGPADFLSSTLSAPPGLTFFRMSLFDSGGEACIIAGIVDSDGVSNYRPLHQSVIKRSLVPIATPLAPPVTPSTMPPTVPPTVPSTIPPTAPPAATPPDAAPTFAPTAEWPIAAAPVADAPWSNSSSFTFMPPRDLSGSDLVLFSGKLCEITQNLTGKTAVTCSITPVAPAKRSTGMHYAEIVSGDASTATSVSSNLEAIQAAFLALFNSPAAPTLAPASSNNNSATGGDASSTGLIVGIVIGILVLIAIVLAVLFVIRRRRAATSSSSSNDTKLTAVSSATELVEVDTASPVFPPKHYSDVSSIKTTKESKKKEKPSKKEKQPKIKSDSKPKNKLFRRHVTAEVEDEPDDSEEIMQPIQVQEPVFDTSDFRSEWMIPFSEIEIEKKLGAGAFGIVYAGSYNDTEVAIKQTNLSVGQSSLDEFKREAVLLLSMKPHPSVVQVLGVSVSESNIYMVMEFCEFGSLDVYMQSNPLSSEDKVKILDSVAAGIAHLHRNQVVHRDIAARNVLLAGGLRAKIADFGMSRIVDKFEMKGTTAATVGPIKFMAPESLTKKKEFSPASDCWTFGILCIELWTGEQPHAGADMLEIAIEIRDHGIHPAIPSDMPDWLQQLVQQCLQFRAADRINMSHISKIFREHRNKRATMRDNAMGTPGHTSASQYPGSASSMPNSGGSLESN